MRIHTVSKIVFLGLISLLSFTTTFSQDNTEIHFLWFSDSLEDVVLRRQITAFEEQNPNITVNLEVLSNFTESNAELSALVNAGTPPDLARTTIPGNFREELLNLRPYLENPDEWEQNFDRGFLASLRKSPSDDGLYGYPADITISAPFINRTMWEEAGVPIPSDFSAEVTWNEWVTAAAEVQAALTTDERKVYAIAIDRSGHRFWGPSLSMCATYVDPEDPQSAVTIDTEGFRETAEMLRFWHKDELLPIEIWAGDSDTLVPADEFFIDQQVAFYFSGNWQLDKFSRKIGDSFVWQVVPNPVGPCGQTGMIGGTTVIALQGNADPEAVGKLVDFLTEYDNLSTFYSENSLLPGHVGMNEAGLEYDALGDELVQFQTEIAHASREAFALQYRPDSAAIHGAIREGLIQMLQNEDMTIDDVVAFIEDNIPQRDGPPRPPRPPQNQS